MSKLQGNTAIQRSEHRFAIITALPGLIALIVLVAGPLLYMFFNSLFIKTLAAPIPPQFNWFGNYGKVLSDSRFWNAFKNTMIIMGVGIPVQAFLGLTIALLLSKPFPGSRVIVAMFLIPVMITPIVSGFQWKIILNQRFGPMNYLLGILIGMEPKSWLAEPFLAMVSILIMDTWQWTPFVTVVLLAGLSAIPKQVYEASSVDGSTMWGTLWRVTLPLLKPMFTLVVLLRIIFIFKIFDPVYILTGGGPGISTETLSLLTYITGFKNFNVGITSTLAVVQLIAMVIIAKLFMKLVMGRKER